MDPDTKKVKRKEKERLRKAVPEVTELCSNFKYVDCLDKIYDLGENAMRNLKIYEAAIASLTQIGKFAEAWSLIVGVEDYGHTRKSLSISTYYYEAVCNFNLSKDVEAYHLFSTLLDYERESKWMDVATLTYCRDAVKELLERSRDEIEKSVERIGDKLIQETEAAKPSSSSTSNVESRLQAVVPVAPESLKAVVESRQQVVVPVAPESESLKAVVESRQQVVVPVAPESESLKAVVESRQQVVVPVAPESLKFQGNMSFEIEMEKLDEQSYGGSIKIGLCTFQKALIIPNEKQRNFLNESTYRAPTETEGNPFLLTSEFLVNSPFLSCVVEPVCPVQVFFERELMKFTTASPELSDNKEEWWKFISKSFLLIFRGIIRGLVAIHSAHKACGDLDCSMYVTEGGEGRIFYVTGEKLSECQKDLDDLLSTMESVVTLIDPRPRTEKQVWHQEFENSYKLPYNLVHFFSSLRDNKVANHKIHTKWLIYHPTFWPVGHVTHFIRTLNDVFRQNIIVESKFVSYFTKCKELKDWNVLLSGDNLLKAIYFHGPSQGSQYERGKETKAIHFILAVLNHANDRDHGVYRSPNPNRIIYLTPDEIEKRIATVFPTIYTSIYDAMCVYANNLQDDCEHDKLLKALERFFSLSP